jgi:uncharacterized protein with HEPN domain
MEAKTKACLYDILTAGQGILNFVAAKTFEDYEANQMLRLATEREFEIIGEALVRIRNLEESLLDEIPDAFRVIAFRNILVHGYDVINNVIVWDAIQYNLPDLLQKVSSILKDQ